MSTTGNSRIGSMRNARLNQARTHADEIMERLTQLCRHPKVMHIEQPDAWQDLRNALEQLCQCVHEANAYNNAMRKDK